EPQQPSDPVHPDVHIQDSLVKRRTDPIQQPIEMRQAIELMPMQNHVTFAIRGDMDNPLRQSDVAEIQTEELLEELVVIADDERHARLLAIFAQQLLHEQIILLRPEPFTAQLPAVDEVADDVKLFALRFAEKIQQLAHLRMPRAQVNIRNPN